jgi:tetratricopeptide (TPR) repeat protein
MSYLQTVLVLAFVLGLAPIHATSGAGATGPQSPTATSKASQLLLGIDRDLRVLEKGQLTSDERKQRDRARSVAQRAREMLQGAKGAAEMEALSLAVTASRELGVLVTRQLRLDELVSGAERYRAFDSASVQAATEYLASDLEAPVRYIEENRDRLGDEVTALARLDDKNLAALALLETDVAFRGAFDAPVRVACARRLLNAADRSRLPPRFVERWYVAVAGYLQGDLLLVDTMRHVEDAVRRFPNDAEILVVAGMFYELLAPPGFELPPREAQGRFDSGITVGGVTGARTSSSGTVNLRPASSADDGYESLVAAKKAGFGQAEAFYRRALAADAANAEAHLRLGRVLSLTSRPDEALSELRPVANSTVPRLRYLASIFEGIVHESAERMDAALASYQEAVRACPGCLSGGVALSHAQRRTGAAAAAEQTLDAAMARDARDAFEDYWWDYPLGALRQRDGLLAQLRGALR